MSVPQTLETLARFIETAPDAMIVVGADGGIVAANSRAESLLGATSGLIGVNVDELVPEAIRDGHGALRAGFLADPAPRPMGAGRELRAQRRDGTELPVEVSLGSVDVDGARCVSVAIRDSSDRLAAQMRAATFEFVVGSSTEAMFTTDAAGRVTLWNQGAERLTGTSARAALGWPLAECLGLEDEALSAAVVERALRGEVLDSIRTVIARAGGGSSPIALSLASMTDPDGAIIGVSGIARDVSEEVETQEFLAEVQGRMLETQRLADIGLWAWDPTRDEIQWSEQLYEISGVSPLDFGGDLEAHLALVPEPSRSEVADAMRAAVLNRSRVVVGYEIVRPDEDRRYLEVSGDPVLDDRGRVTALRGVCQDVTGRQRAIEALVEADRAKDEFLATISHELRTPLTSIIGFGDMLLTELPEATATWASVIVRNGREMHAMIERILDFSRAQSGRVLLDLEDKDIASFFEELAPLLEASVTNHTVLYEVDAGLAFRVDVAACRRIFVNLLANAAKFTPDKSTITVRATTNDHWARVEILDEGPGIPEAEQERVFERFYQVTENLIAARRGVGVGLSIVRSYTEALGGRVWVENRPTGGAAFIVEVPKP